MKTKIDNETGLTWAALYREGWSTQMIADDAGVRRLLVRYHLIKHGVQIRSRSEAMKLACKLGRKKNYREHSSVWKGGRTHAWFGHILVLQPEHPRANSMGYVREHHLVMEAHMGRYLKPSEIVHHRNGDVRDNRIENLELMTQKEHGRIHGGHNRKFILRWEGKPHLSITTA